MDSQVDSETLNNLLVNDMISLSSEESDIDLLGSDPNTNSRDDMRTTKHFSILDELLASPPIPNSTNTTTSTTSSTITHLLSCMIVTTTHSTINTTIRTHTLRHQPTAATLPTSTTPLSPNTSYNASPSPLPIHTHPPSTSTAKSKSTPSDLQSEHLPFTFHFIPGHPNYTSKLKLSMHIAKLCSNIQQNGESSIIQIIEKHLSKQKHKKTKKKPPKNADNFKPRFRPIEHSPPYTARKTDTTTTTQHNPTNPQNHNHTVHSSNPQNHRHSIYPTNLPEPLFHPYQITASFTIPTKHPSYITTHAQIYTIR